MFNKTMISDVVKPFVRNLQNQLCLALEEQEQERKFLEDAWSYDNGQGGGWTRVLEQGKHLERAGVNVSHIKGEKLPAAATLKRPELAGFEFEALGLSSVIHPRNPYAPTSHVNVRIFSAYRGDTTVWWFGGGFDLTPYYGFVEDCQLWHQHAKQACDVLGAGYYEKFKAECDDYFYLKHRNEPRGIGGIFYDDLNEPDFETCFDFMKSVGTHFITAYSTILARRKDYPYGERERAFQLYRRGRYVEFNLVLDRGTLFGLQSHGRTESILVSMPPEVTWRYDWQPALGSPEEELYRTFLIKKDWI